MSLPFVFTVDEPVEHFTETPEPPPEELGVA